jgi:hypothetical protein
MAHLVQQHVPLEAELFSNVISNFLLEHSADQPAGGTACRSQWWNFSVMSKVGFMAAQAPSWENSLPVSIPSSS